MHSIHSTPERIKHEHQHINKMKSYEKISVYFNKSEFFFIWFISNMHKLTVQSIGNLVHEAELKPLSIVIQTCTQSIFDHIM